MYFKVFLLACLVTDIYSANSNLNLQDVAGRIIGGEDARPGQFPYLVSIQQPSESYDPRDHNCGGAILNERWILTAAHCLKDDGTPLVVKAGKYDLRRKESSEQVVAVKKIFKHKLYDGNANDIALMKLRTPLKLNKRVGKVALPEKDSEPTGEMGTVAGWGYWNLHVERDPIAPIVLTVTMPIISRKSCNKLLKKLNTEASIIETHICTFGSPEGGIGPCNGDSGSPLVVTNDRGEVEIVGIDSWSLDPCTDKGAPEVYTRVSNFIDWIENIINSNKC